ncbi:hypothetical protein GCM10008967_15630 [Bacillus carboniphilus]|uniref:Zinc-ribbon domain-containing protein n=1 Tax=Bacillus carboniphilus TaxID=86663 RepID=A0ABN0W6A8_9BACI
MFCGKCGHNNATDAKFCVKCGSSLSAEATSHPATNQTQDEMAATTVTVTQHQPASQGNANTQQYLEKGKVISKQYFSYFLSGLKQPVAVAEKVNKSELTNGLITLVIYSLMIPLMIYFAVKNAFKDSFFGPVEISFVDVVIIPTFILVIFLAVIGLIIFGVIKIGGSSVSYLDVLSRYGAFQIVPTAFLFVALIFSLLGSEVLFSIFFALCVLGSTTIIPLMIYSYKRDGKGLDTFYSILLAYIGIIILYLILGEQAFEAFESFMYSFDPFGF